MPPARSCAALLMLSLLSACAPKAKPVEMFWPDPPDKTRIKFVGLLQTPHDVKGPSFREILVGQDRQVALHQPTGLDISEDGQRLYVADRTWNAVFVFDFANKDFRSVGTDARFPVVSPLGVAVDSQDNVYIVSLGAEPLVRVYDRNGAFLRDIGKGQVSKPTGVAVDRKRGRLYVVDTGHNERTEKRGHRVKIFGMDGAFIGEFGRRGLDDGEFNFPTYAKVGPDGLVYVVDSANSRVQVFDAEGNFVRKIGRAGDQIGDFARAKGVAVDTFGNLYVTDSRWGNVQMFNREGRLLMYFGGVGTYPGLMMNPADIVIDNRNRIYVADGISRRVSIYDLVNTTAEDGIPEAPAADTPVEADAD